MINQLLLMIIYGRPTLRIPAVLAAQVRNYGNADTASFLDNPAPKNPNLITITGIPSQQKLDSPLPQSGVVRLLAFYCKENLFKIM